MIFQCLSSEMKYPNESRTDVAGRMKARSRLYTSDIWNLDGVPINPGEIDQRKPTSGITCTSIGHLFASTPGAESQGAMRAVSPDRAYGSLLFITRLRTINALVLQWYVPFPEAILSEGRGPGARSSA